MKIFTKVIVVLALTTLTTGDPLIFGNLRKTLASLACKCECRHVKVEKCKNIVRENCHTEHEKRCETYSGKEICVQKPRKSCHREYRKECQKRKECKTSYRTKCIKIPYETCYNKPYCKTTYKEDCKPNYEYGHTCKKIPQEHCTYERKCDVDYDEKCQKVPEEKCRYVDDCVKKPYPKCTIEYDKHCKKEPVKVCNPFAKKKCKKVIKKVPIFERHRECQKCYQTKKEVVDKIPDKQCYKEPKNECHTEYTEDCHKVPRRKCTKTKKRKCDKVPVQECKKVTKKECKQKPYSDCKATFGRECHLEQKCHVTFKLNCKRRPKTGPVYAPTTPSPRQPLDEYEYRTQKPYPMYHYMPDVDPKYRRPLYKTSDRDYRAGFEPSVRYPNYFKHYPANPELVSNANQTIPKKVKPYEVYYKPYKPSLKREVGHNETKLELDPEQILEMESQEEKRKNSSSDLTVFDPKIDILGGLLKKIGRSDHFEQLDYGYIRRYCAYEPQRECKKEEICKEDPKTDCEIKYKSECFDVPDQECSTVYKENCYEIPDEKCTTAYEDECRKVPHEKCETRYESKCVTRYKEVKRYEPVNHCYWPKSVYRDEPCHK